MKLDGDQFIERNPDPDLVLTILDAVQVQAYEIADALIDEICEGDITLCCILLDLEDSLAAEGAEQDEDYVPTLGELLLAEIDRSRARALDEEGFEDGWENGSGQLERLMARGDIHVTGVEGK